jgi:hypothetical protein
MSNSSSMTIDMTEIDKRLLLMDIRVNQIVKKAMWEAAAALKKDCDEIAPKTPHLHGNLRGNAERNPKAKGPSKVRKDYWPQITEETLGFKIYGILLTYCAPYAARWHEAVGENINWSEDGVGPKFIEAKLARADLRDKYYKLLADSIKEGIAND